MPKYQPVFSPTAQRQIGLLPEKIATAAIEFIFGDLSGNPYMVGTPLRKPLLGKYKATRGTYRIIYMIDDTKMEVIIQDIVARADAYRRR